MTGLLTPNPLQFVRQYNDAPYSDMTFSTTSDRMAYLTSPRRYAGMIVTDNERQEVFILSADTNSWISIQNSSSVSPLEVKVGSSEAIAAGIIAGSTTIVNSLYANRDLEISRTNINLYTKDFGDGDAYFTKPYGSDTVILSVPLYAGEIIKIKIL